MVVDAFGEPVTVGDTVAIGQPQRGAQPFSVGTIVKCGPKTITVEVVTYPRHWRTGVAEECRNNYQRVSGSFVVKK